MKIERWDTKEVIFELECSSWADLMKAALKEKISFYGANLRGADLSYTDLHGANLRGADLRFLVGNGEEVKTMHLEKYMVVFTKDVLVIGCESHPISEWEDFTDKEIDKMDSGALDWWNKWKDFIFKAIELSHKTD